MAKVIDSKGLNDFIETGKHEVIAPHKAEKAKTEEAPKVEKAEKVEEKVEAKEVDPDGDKMPEETLEQARAKIAKKHAELQKETAWRKRLEQESAENERLAESQFNERRLVESERDRVKRELEELRLRAAPVKAETIKEPDENDPQFKDEAGNFSWKKFMKAQADYAVETFKAGETAKQQAAERAALEVEVNKRIEIAKAKYPDFMEVLEGQAERKDVPAYIMQFLFESEQGADLAYYFGKNREELTKISALSPIKALARLGKLETRFEPKDEKVEKVSDEKVPDEKVSIRTSTAPPPITPLSGASSGTVITDPSKMSFQQLRAFEREKMKRKG